MTVVLCQHCGADLSHHPLLAVEEPSTSKCFDCGLASDDGGAWQPSFEADEVIRYRLDDWSPGQRLALALALYDVPFRWDPGPVIVVREEGRSVVEAFLHERGTVGVPADREAGSDDEDATGEGVESAMSDLFLGADQLVRAPWDGIAMARVRELGVLVGSSMPPFGIEPRVWDELAARAAGIAAAGHAGDLEGVEERARHLRLFLRDLV